MVNTVITEKKADSFLNNKYVTLVIGAILGALATYAMSTPNETDDKAVAFVTKQWTEYQASQNSVSPTAPVTTSTTAVTTPVTQEQVEDAQEQQEELVK